MGPSLFVGKEEARKCTSSSNKVNTHLYWMTSHITITLFDLTYYHCITEATYIGDFFLQVIKRKIQAGVFYIFTLSQNTHSRGNSLKLYIPYTHRQFRLYYFSVRIINHWNQLPNEIVNCTSTKCLKTQIDNYYSDIKFTFL